MIQNSGRHLDDSRPVPPDEQTAAEVLKVNQEV